MTTGEVRSVVTERDLPHPPERIWRALTEPHLIADWLMNNDFVPAVGYHFSLRGEWGGVLSCEVLAIEPPRLLSYTWIHAHQDHAFALDSVVTFTLTPTDAGTHLRVEQNGFRLDQRKAFGGASQGWIVFIDKLSQVAARLA